MRSTLTIVVPLVAPTPVSADPVKAESLDAAGKTAFQKGAFADAVVAFRAAFEEDARPDFLFNLAKAQQKLGDFGGAIETLDRYLEEVPKASDRKEIEAFQTFLRGKLEATKVHLTVRTNPGGALLRLDSEGGPTDHTTPWTGWVEPGRYKLALTKSGHTPVHHEFVVELGNERNLELRLTPMKTRPGGEPKVMVPPASATPEDSASGSAWPYVALGVAVAAGAGAAWAGGLSGRAAVEDAAKTRDRVEYREAIDRADQRTTVSNALGATAAVGLLAAGALWFVEF